MSLNKLSIYLIIMLLYLGISKSFSPSEFGISYILNDNSLAKIVQGAPVSVVLVDMHKTGFLINTHYHKYKIIYGFQAVEEIVVRTSSKFAQQHSNNLGLSIFRRYENDLKEDFTPLPPGSIFIGDRSFGRWVKDNSGESVWKFYRPYRNIPVQLGWDDYIPTLKDANQINNYALSKKPFYGPNNEFGTDGSVSKKVYSNYFGRQKPKSIDFKKVISDYFKENFKGINP